MEVSGQDETYEKDPSPPEIQGNEATCNRPEVRLHESDQQSEWYEFSALAMLTPLVKARA
jgi:hypothetical protein